MRIEMKLIQSAFLVASLLALNASAQPTPPPAQPPAQQPAPPPNQPPTTGRPTLAPPGNRPGPNMPPGLMQGAPKTPPVMPEKEKLSYAIGFNIAGSVKKDELDIDIDTLATAMKDVLGGKPTRYNEKE